MLLITIFYSIGVRRDVKEKIVFGIAKWAVILDFVLTTPEGSGGGNCDGFFVKLL